MKTVSLNYDYSISRLFINILLEGSTATLSEKDLNLLFDLTGSDIYLLVKERHLKFLFIKDSKFFFRLSEVLRWLKSIGELPHPINKPYTNKGGFMPIQHLNIDKTSMSQVSPVLGVTEVAILLKKSRATISRWCQLRTHNIPMRKIGNSYLGEREQIITWFKAITRGDFYESN